jgi:hypothetical protein
MLTQAECDLEITRFWQEIKDHPDEEFENGVRRQEIDRLLDLRPATLVIREPSHAA